MKRARKEPSLGKTELKSSGINKSTSRTASRSGSSSATRSSGMRSGTSVSRSTGGSLEGTKSWSGSSWGADSGTTKRTTGTTSSTGGDSIGGTNKQWNGSSWGDGSKLSKANTDASKSATGTKRTTSAKSTTASKSATAKKASTKKTSSKKASSKKKGKKKRHIIRKIFIALFILFFIGTAVLVGMGAGMYKAIYSELENMNIRSLAVNQSSVVYYYDEDGNQVEEVQLHYQGERRIWVESSEISINLKNAAVAIEDERFYEHNGVDLKRTAGATIGWILEKVGLGSADYGGSTLTQQLVKNITNEKDKSADRKIKEIMRAIALEEQIGDKDAILTMYLNISYFGNQCYGVEAASNLYFAKQAKDVTIAEAATIVGITQSPSYYDPVKNPDNALEKRNRVLGKMYELGYISESEYNEAKELPIGLSETVYEPKKVIYSYFVDAVIEEVVADLVEQKGLSKTAAEQMVFNGGLKIYTTMDKDVQENMENIYENRTGFPTSDKTQSAMVVVDPKTGEIKGIVGGVGVKTDARGFNRATQSTRQPGSSIKPLSVYAPAMELGLINAASVIRDEAVTIKVGNKDWSPKNAYSGYKGDLVLSKCIEISSNTTAVKVLEDLGVSTSYDYARYKFNLSGMVEADRSYAPLALGGLTHGVTVVDMAAAYATFANGGVYNEPHTYTKVVDSSGKVLLENKSSSKRVLSEETAFIMTDVMANVVTGSSGTAKEAKLNNNIAAYGKTGTTNDNYDKWFVGYTTRYVGAVWFGCDTNTDLKSLGIKNNPSCAIWKKVMDKIHEGITNEAFEPPETVNKATLCSKTGKLASSGCLYARSGYFAAEDIPTSFCKRACNRAKEEEKKTETPVTPETPETPTTTDDTVTDIDTTPSDTKPSTNEDTKSTDDDSKSETPKTDTTSPPKDEDKQEEPADTKPPDSEADKADGAIVIE